MDTQVGNQQGLATRKIQNGGEGGIRTPGTRGYTGFRNRPVRPLRHLSAENACPPEPRPEPRPDPAEGASHAPDGLLRRPERGGPRA